jgi:hypothetical protein
VQDLTTNVDKALLDALGTLPPEFSPMTAAFREYEMRHIPQIADDEKAVALFYRDTTAKYCTGSVNPRFAS